MILNLVPKVATFRTTLRAIRLWAKSELVKANKANGQNGGFIRTSWDSLVV